MTEWTKTRCDGSSACVQVRETAGFVQLRAGVDPHAVLSMTRREWCSFAAAVHAGDFDWLTSDE